MQLASAIGVDVYDSRALDGPRAISSDMDIYPDPEQRPLFAADYLARLDAEAADYEASCREWFREDLKAIIAQADSWR